MKLVAIAAALALLPTIAFADVDTTRTAGAPPAQAAAPNQEKDTFAGADAAALRAKRAELAGKAYELAVQRMSAGAGTVDAVIQWSLRWRDAEAAIDPRLAALHNLERAKHMEPAVRDRVNSGVAASDALIAVQWWHADAELLTR